MNNDIRNVELTIEQAEQMIKVGEAQARLLKNPDFKLVWMAGFVEEGSKGAVIGKANPALQSETHQAAFIKEIDAIGSFVNHGNMVMMQGQQAAQAIEGDRQTLEELRAEGLGE